MKNLIPLAYLNESCFLSLNVDEKKYKMVLKLAQESLKDILGQEFYDQIDSQYAPANDTLSVDNAALYEGYIKDFLAWQTYHNFLGFSQSDVTPTGVREFKDDNSDLVRDIKLVSLEKNVATWATYYKDRMVNFLRLSQANLATKYPLWKERCNNEFAFAYSCIEKDSRSAKIVSVSKAVRANE